MILLATTLLSLEANCATTSVNCQVLSKSKQYNQAGIATKLGKVLEARFVPENDHKPGNK